jgi:NTE family protein
MEITLALSGGGTRGNAHIGVLRRLEQEGFQIKAVAGTSAGGLVGALYCCGRSPQEILESMQQVDQTRLFGRRPEDGPALLGVAGIQRLLLEHVGERTFDELAIPLAVTAVDLNSGREVYLRKGRVREAVLATIALPGILPPQKWGDSLLVDGGVLDPVPVSLARFLAPQLPVVASVLTTIPEESTHLPEPPPFLGPPQVLRQISRLRIAQAFAIFIQSVEIADRALADLRLKVDQPEVIIRPLLHDIGLLDPVDIPDLVRRGDQAVELALPALHQAVGWQNRLRLGLRATFHPPEETQHA